MTKQVVTIENSDGQITIDAELFTEYNKRAQDILEQISELEKDLQEEVETVAETTGMKAAKVKKYFKERYKNTVRNTVSTGEVFGKLTDILDGKDS
jgi:ABC-type Zn uptake system ZnuABC Zn-binding protein ZnuA